MPKREKKTKYTFWPPLEQMEPETDPTIIEIYQKGHDQLVKKGLITSDGKLAPRREQPQSKGN